MLILLQVVMLISYIIHMNYIEAIFLALGDLEGDLDGDLD